MCFSENLIEEGFKKGWLIDEFIVLNNEMTLHNWEKSRLENNIEKTTKEKRK